MVTRTSTQMSQSEHRTESQKGKGRLLKEDLWVDMLLDDPRPLTERVGLKEAFGAKPAKGADRGYEED